MTARQRLEQEIAGYNTLQKRKENDEVFTPFYLIEDMLDRLPAEAWTNPNKKWLDPCAGLGNFSVIILERLMEGLKDWQPDPELREGHILENMLYHVELNPESCQKLQRVLNPHGKWQLNIRQKDFLKTGYINQKSLI